MNPILFLENSTTWNTNGLGRLSDAISCKVKEQRNGEYELELTYPTSGKHFSDISIRKIIAAIPSQGSTLQPFRIYRITRPIRGKVTVKARHISYDLSKYVCTPFSVAASSSACASVLSNLKSGSVKSCPFSFWTDVTTVASYSQMTPASIRQRLGGIEGSVLDQFGGEYEWDGLTVKLHRQRGTVTNYTLRYGKNITDVNQDENIAETATGVVPFWSDVEGTTVITGDVIEKQGVSYSSPLIIPLDLSSEWQTAPTVAQLNTAATVYVNKSDFGIPKVSVDVSFVNLADTEEYKNILPMQSLHLCDTVKVQFEELGIDTTAKVVETVYDVLAERYESIQIGSLKSSLAGLITDYEASMAQTVSDTGKRVFAEAGSAAQDAVNNATAWLTGSNGYVVAIKNQDGSWKELLFMDTNDVQTARNVLRMNENGIGFSRNGVGGPYTNAWTIDGNLVADFITTGLLKSASGENYWDLDTGEFCLTSTSKVRVIDTNYTGTVFPNAYNYPASSWTTYAEKTAHVGETYKNTNTGKYYKWQPKDTKVHFKFSSPSATEKNYDYVEIYYQQNGKWYKSGKFDGGWNGTTNNISNVVVNVPVSDFFIYWKSNGSNVDWGFQIDTIGGGYSGTTPYTEYDSDPRPSGVTWTYTPTGSGIGWPQTSHNYGNNESIGWEFDLTPSYGQFEWIEYDPVMPLGEYVEDTADLDLDQESVFNALTNNGENQGLYLYNGKVYLNGEYLGAGAISIGGSNYSAKPSLTIKDANNNVIGSWSKDGITWNTDNSSMTADGTLSAKGTFSTEGTVRVFGRDRTIKTEMSHGDLSFYIDGTETFAIEAYPWTRGGGKISSDTGDMTISFHGGVDIDGGNGVHISTNDPASENTNWSYIDLENNFCAINIISGSDGNGDLDLTVEGDLTISDGQSGGIGVTGTYQGLHFKKGICIGSD